MKMTERKCVENVLMWTSMPHEILFWFFFRTKQQKKTRLKLDFPLVLMRWKLNRTTEPCAHEPLWSLNWNVYRAHSESDFTISMLTYVLNVPIIWCLYHLLKSGSTTTKTWKPNQQYRQVLHWQLDFIMRCAQLFLHKMQILFRCFSNLSKVLAYTFVPVLLFHLSFRWRRWFFFAAAKLYYECWNRCIEATRRIM